MVTDQTGSSIITAVEQQQRNKRRYNIFLNEEFAFSVHEDILIRHRLLKGESVDKEQIANIMKDDEQEKAMHAALRFIGRKPRSVREVKLNLKDKGFEPEIVGKVIHHLSEQKLLDDGHFAKLWTEERVYSQNRGRKWVQQELLHKGVSGEDIANALEQIDEEAEWSSAYEMGFKKWIRLTGSIQEKKQKIGIFLLRRGYPSSMVSKVLYRLQSESIEDNIED